MSIEEHKIEESMKELQYRGAVTFVFSM